MEVLSMVAMLAIAGPDPVLWLNSEGQVLLQGKPVKGARLTKGATAAKTPFGIGLDLDGTHGGLLMPDVPALALTDAMTISTWVYLRGYVQDGPGAQIFFRGDDRNGLDPYSLCVHSDGTVAFGISDTAGGADVVSTRIPLNKWVHITASFDAALCEEKLWIGEVCVQSIQTEHQPIMTLAKGSAPGVSIGNVQNDKGPHNQPLNGIVADFRFYNTALRPAQIGYLPLVESSAK